MSIRVRHPIGPPVQAAAVTTLRIRTRLRVSDADRAVIVALGAHLGRLARADLAKRSRAGLDHSEKVWAERKRALTKESSSRWAGAITKASNDAYATARRNQLRQQADLSRAIATLEEKIELPCHSAKERGELRASQPGRKLKFGYRSEWELAMKRQRLQHLQARKTRLDRDVKAGRVHITRGGKRLLRNRLHLDQAGITKEQWRKTRNGDGNLGSVQVGKDRSSRPGVTNGHSAGTVPSEILTLIGGRAPRKGRASRVDCGRRKARNGGSRREPGGVRGVGPQVASLGCRSRWSRGLGGIVARLRHDPTGGSSIPVRASARASGPVGPAGRPASLRYLRGDPTGTAFRQGTLVQATARDALTERWSDPAEFDRQAKLGSDTTPFEGRRAGVQTAMVDPGSGIASDAAALSPMARLTQATFPLVQFQTGSDVQFEVVTEPVAGLGAVGRPATGPASRSGLEQPPRRHQRFGQTPSPAFAG